MLKFTCSNCNHKIGAPEKYAGKRVRCPKCKAPTRVPESIEKTDAKKSDLIKFRCPNCEQKIGLTPDYAGKRVRCAKCKNFLRVPLSPGQPERPRIRDETEVLKAGHEQFLPEQDIWGDMPSMDELLSAEESATAAERQVQPGPAGIETGESELPEYASKLGQLSTFPQTTLTQKQPSIKIAKIVLAITLILGFFVVVGSFAWLFFDVFGSVKHLTSLPDPNVEQFAKEYIYLLESGQIEEAARLLTPELQNQIQKTDIEDFAKKIGKNKITSLECNMTYSEQIPEGKQFFLWYNLSYDQDTQSVIINVIEFEDGMRVNGIAAQSQFDTATSIRIGPRSFDELAGASIESISDKFLARFTKYSHIFSAVSYVFILIQSVAWWILFTKVGRPGWAALVPVYNMWVLAEVADRPGWWGLVISLSWFLPTFGNFLPTLSMCMFCFLPIIAIASLILSIIISIVSQVFGHGILFGIGLFLLPFIFYPILAFASD